jgi:hypothetical protein
MSRRTLIVLALAGPLSLLAQQAIAQDSRPVHGDDWPIQNGIKHQPTRAELGGGQEFSRGQAEETDRLYNELMSNGGTSHTHHTGVARMR